MNLRSLPHQGGGGAFHGDAAGGSQVGHGDVVLHRDLSLLGQPGQGFYHAGVRVAGQEYFAGAAIVQRAADLLAPTTLLTLLSSDTISVPSSPPAKAGVVSLGKGRKAPYHRNFRL